MMRGLLLALGCCSCAPMLVGPGRVLPPALQFELSEMARGEPPTHPPAVPERLISPQGIRVVLAENHDVALVDVALLLRCGLANEVTPGAEVLRVATRGALTGGDQARTARQQGDAMERLGIDASITVDDAESWVRFTIEREALAAAMELISDGLRSPRWEEAQLAALIRLGAEGRESAREKRSARVHQLQREVVYDNAGLAAQTRASSIGALTRALVASQASRCFVRENLVIALAGDVDAATALQAVTPFERFPQGAPTVFDVKSREPTRRRLWLVNGKEERRVLFTFVGPGLPVGTRDAAAAEVMLTELQSALYGALRGVGQLYSSEAKLEIGPANGTMFVRFTTGADQAVDVLKQTLNVLRRLKRDWSTEREWVDVIRRHRAGQSDTERAFDVAKLLVRERELADLRPFDEQLQAVKSARVEQLFLQAFDPERVQIIVSGDVGPLDAWWVFDETARLDP